MEIGIVILNYYSSELVLKVIKNILLQQVDLKICIVDNSCDKGESLKIIKISEMSPEQIDVLINNENSGYYKGNLTGLKYLYEKYGIKKAVVMNPDIEFNELNKIILKMNEIFTEGKDVFIVGTKIVIPGYEIFSSPILKFSAFNEICYNLFFPCSNIIRKKIQTYKSKFTGKVFAVEGSFYMVDIVKYIMLEPYFKNIFLYGEEIIFGKAALINKWKIIYLSEVNVLHFHPPAKESNLYDSCLRKSLEQILKEFVRVKIMRQIVLLSYDYKIKIKKFIYFLRKNGAE